MTPDQFDDQTLMAYADGEADPQTAARLEQALAGDGALAIRLAVFIESRAAVQAALAPQLAEPLPSGLEASVRAMAARQAEVPAPGAAGAGVVSLADRRAARGSGFLPVALAAGLALAVGLGAGFLTGRSDVGQSPLEVAALADPAVTAALADLLSGDERDLPGGAKLRAIASFRDGSGALCREVEHDRADGATVVVVACRDAGDWSLRLAVAAGSEGGYAPVSSLETLDAYLASTEAGAPLSQEEEAAALVALR